MRFSVANNTNQMSMTVPTGPGMDAGDLYKNYFHHILNLVRKYHTCKDTSRDMAMDVFIKVLFNLDKYREQGKGLLPWISTITRNEIMQAFRKEKYKNKKIPTDISELYHLSQEESDYDPMEERITTDWPLIKNILLNMDEASFRLIYMRFYCRLPFRDIAQKMGITENNAKVKMNRLLKRIYREYQKSVNKNA